MEARKRRSSPEGLSLRVGRVRLGLIQADVARRLMLYQVRVSQIETGSKGTSRETRNRSVPLEEYRKRRRNR